MQTVKIRLRKPRRVFAVLCPDMPLRRDEVCVVQSDRGLEFGAVVLPPEPCPPEMERRYAMRVVRKINGNDEDTRRFLETEEVKARTLCKERIKDHKLPMKLVDAEYSFDKRKVVFYFTAEDRVDFRDLVRDLARELRTRIELRHIQVRDEAKMVGGIGGCGRELCCTTWLNEFKPISMRMAKKQNLSLNPSKISGQCGRLLCCLAYENDMYETAKRQARPLPPPGEGAPGDAPRPEQPRRDDRPPRGDDRPPRADSRPPRREDRSTRQEDRPPRQDDQAAAPPPAPREGDAPGSPAEGGARRRGRRRRGGGNAPGANN